MYFQPAAAAHLSSAWSDQLTTRLAVSFNNKRRDGVDPHVAEPFERVYQSTILSAGRLSGNGQLATIDSPTSGYATQPNSKITAAELQSALESLAARLDAN